MKYSIIICFMLMTIPISILSQVYIDDALLNKSEMLKLKRGFSRVSGNLQKTSFGPFKTVNINSGKQHLVGRQNNPYVGIAGKNVSLKKSVSTTSSKPYSITIIQEGADTIISNMDLITIKGGNRALIQLGKRNAADDESSVSYCEDMMIQIRNDTLNWHMPQNNNQTDPAAFPASFDRILTNGVDNILVKEAEGFPSRFRMDKNMAQGIVFIHNKKQIAALATYPEISIWLSNTINERHKQVIAAVMISLLSISKTP